MMNTQVDKQDLILQLLHTIQQDQALFREDVNRRFSEAEKRDENVKVEMNRRFSEAEKRDEDVKVEMNRRFSEAEKRDEELKIEMNRRFSEAEKRDEDFRSDVKQHFKEVKHDLRLDKEKLEKVYEARERVTVNFTRAFAFGNASVAAILAIVISFFMPHR